MAGELSPLLDGIKVVADAAAREAVWPIATRPQNARVYRIDADTLERWSGSAWVPDLGGRGFNVKRFGAVGNGVIATPASGTDDYAAIQLAIDTCWAAGGGVVTFPDAAVYKILNSLIGRDNVTLDLMGSTIANLRTSGDLPDRNNSGIFYVGGYEGGANRWVQNETFVDCNSQTAGLTVLSVGATAYAALIALGLVAGDMLFLRSTAQDLYFGSNGTTIKDIPRAQQITEVVSLDGTAKTITIRDPLYDDFLSLKIARSTGQLDPYGIPKKVIKYFNVRNGKVWANGAVFAFGGKYRCTVTDLEVLNSSFVWIINAMAHCSFARVKGRYNFGNELGYYCHHNTFTDCAAEWAYQSGATNFSGMNVCEGAHDNTFTDFDLNHGTSPSLALNLSTGRRNVLVNPTISSANGQNASVVLIAAKGLQYKPVDSGIRGGSIIIASNDPTSRPQFHWIIDSGGADGGGCFVDHVTHMGLPKIGNGMFARLDIRDATASAGHCLGNRSVGSIATVSDEAGTRRIPFNARIYEYNNLSPDGSSLEFPIDSTWRPGHNVVTSGSTRLKQTAASEFNLGAFSNVGETTIRSYLIPRYSVGTQSRWRMKIRGTASNTAGTKIIIAYLTDGTNTYEIGRASVGATVTGAYGLDIDIGNKSLGTGLASVLVYETAIKRKVSVAKVEVVGTVTQTVMGISAPMLLDSTLTDVTLYFTQQGGAGLTVDEYEVIPIGDEWSQVDWPLVLAMNGGYLGISY